MTSSRKISGFFVRKMESQSECDLSQTLLEMCTQFGWANATFFGSGMTEPETPEDILITTYEQGWVDRYMEQEYKFIDPVVSQGAQSLLPLDWSTIKQDTPELRAFFGEAKELGVGRSGLTVAVRGVNGESSLFSVNSSESGEKWKLQRDEMVADLTYFAHLFHGVVWDQQNPNHQRKVAKLTRREQDVLRWAARGKTAWETAKILNLTEKTVAFYLSNITAKLKVATKTQAVAVAITQRLLVM